MPNAYHDEQGRFCSKGQMRSAIDNLAKNVNDPKQLDEYFKLRTEYEAAAGEAYTPTPEKKTRPKYNYNKGKLVGHVPSEHYKKQTALRAKKAELKERIKARNLQGTQVTEQELQSATDNMYLRDIVEGIQKDNIVVTKEDVGFIHDRLQTVNGKGYGAGVDSEYNGTGADSYSPKKDVDAVLGETSFGGVSDQTVEWKFESLFTEEYEKAVGQGAWDV